MVFTAQNVPVHDSLSALFFVTFLLLYGCSCAYTFCFLYINQMLLHFFWLSSFLAATFFWHCVKLIYILDFSSLSKKPPHPIKSSVLSQQKWAVSPFRLNTGDVFLQVRCRNHFTSVYSCLFVFTCLTTWWCILLLFKEISFIKTIQLIFFYFWKS